MLQKLQTDLELSLTPLANGCRKWRHDPAWPTLFSVAVSVHPDQSCIFVHLLLQYSPQAVINWIQIWQIWRPQLRWNKCGVSFADNAVTAPAWWAFLVSQGSVETLFIWGGKRLHDFAANLLRKPCTKFPQNRPSFVEDITKNILVSFFQTHCTCICITMQWQTRKQITIQAKIVHA